jgi:glycosidase
VLDGVFNHVGRDFWAFQDVLRNGQASAYCDWFFGLEWNGRSPYGDPFKYEGWSGHYDLVKLNLANPAVRQHLFEAVAFWITEFKIDGLRLDAADVLDSNFMQALASFCRSLDPTFWLMGEVVHGDYKRWANPSMLDSVTNYECYKGLYSSHYDKNYFEIAYAFNRQSGPAGIYRDLALFNFADNHDVNRVASNLLNPAHLYPLYTLLFTMPGIPSLYYGSEWGTTGVRDANGDDSKLRPFLELQTSRQTAPQPNLVPTIARLAQIRQTTPALRYGDYQELLVSAEQLAFARSTNTQTVVIVVNAAPTPVSLSIPMPGFATSSNWYDLLNTGQPYQVSNGKLHINTVWSHWACILVWNN